MYVTFQVFCQPAPNNKMHVIGLGPWVNYAWYAACSNTNITYPPPQSLPLPLAYTTVEITAVAALNRT